MTESIKDKTFKREFAMIVFSVLCWAIFQGDVEMVKILIYPFMAFIALAFGLDWKTKQG